MEYSAPPVDLDTVRLYRLNRVRGELQKRDYAAVVLLDPINTRYATDVTNMQVWSMHNEQRYVLVFADGPVVLFEGESATHLAEDMPTIDEVRHSTAWSEQRCQKANGCALASTVGPDKPKHFTRFDCQVQSLDGHEVAVILPKVGDLNHVDAGLVTQMERSCENRTGSKQRDLG